MATVHEMIVTITKAPPQHVPPHIVREITTLIALPTEHLKPRLLKIIDEHGFGGFSALGKMYLENVVWMLTAED